MARAMSRAQVTRFAIICVDGGETYWHQRADGDDPAGMIVHEVLPRAAAAGMHTGRIGLVGLSMGGYGALLIAEQFSAEQPSTFRFRTKRRGTEELRAGGEPGGGPAVAAVAALSPAVFASYDDARAANPEAFDSPADFTRNDVVSGLITLRRVPAFIACGTDDPFEPEAAVVRSRLAALTHHPVPGGISRGATTAPSGRGTGPPPWNSWPRINPGDSEPLTGRRAGGGRQ
jgi:pimeloyl-ACP methyl ester carboxylesterase